MTALDQETARLIADSVTSYAARGGAAGKGHLAELHAQGWLQAALPESSGGLGFGLDAAAIVAGELARAALAEPVAATYLAARLLALVAPDSAAAMSLGQDGALPALAWTARDEAVSVSAEGRLSGAIRHVAGGGTASQFLILADQSGTPVLLSVPADAPGMTVTPAARADGAIMADLAMDQATGTFLARGGGLDAAMRRVRAETNLVVASELMAHVEVMLEQVLDHLRTRRQFGKPLGAFQALQHKAADLYLHRLLSRGVLDGAIAVAVADHLPDDLDRAAFRARARLNDTAMMVARTAIQMFGALGITEESRLAPHVRRVLSLTGWLGGSAEQRRRYAALGPVATRALSEKAITE